MSALTSLLARDQIVPVRKIEEALQKQVVSGGEMSSVLLELDAVSENMLSAYCAALYGLLPATRDEVMRVSRDTIRLVPRELAERHRMIPLAVDANTLLVAMARPLDREIEEQVGFLLGLSLVIRIVCDVRISAGLVHHYGVDATPRHIRLIDKLRQRDAGPVPFVAMPNEGQSEHLRFSEAPVKRVSTADWLDDGDEEDTDIGASNSSPKVQPAPFAEARQTEPMGFPVTQVERALPLAEDITADVSPSLAMISPPEAAVLERPRSMFEDVKSATHRVSEPPTDTVQALRRLRGPLTFAAATKLLDKARARDEVLEIFFAFSRQFLDYTALFVVHDDVADGRDAFGSGASAKAVRRIAVPLDVPGTFADVRSMLHPHVGPFASSELDAIVLRDLEREPNTPAIVLPVAIRGRAVLLLYGDRGGDPFELEEIPELLSFVPKVEAAFKRLIAAQTRLGPSSSVRRKRRRSRTYGDRSRRPCARAPRIANSTTADRAGASRTRCQRDRHGRGHFVPSVRSHRSRGPFESSRHSAHIPGSRGTPDLGGASPHGTAHRERPAVRCGGSLSNRKVSGSLSGIHARNSTNRSRAADDTSLMALGRGSLTGLGNAGAHA